MKVERKEGLDKVKIHHNRVLFWAIVILFIILLFVIYSIIRISKSEYDKSNNVDNSYNSSIANPASVYCIEHGGNLSIRSDATGGQYGVCVFQDKSECEEWAYFRGECNASGQIGNFSSIRECKTDSDCVPEQCCHAASCINTQNKHPCNLLCTQECAPNTLDCGQGSCACVNNKCTVLMK